MAHVLISLIRERLVVPC